MIETVAWQIAQKKFGQSTFARWSQNSKIVEAFAEHDFRFRRFGGMVRAMECARILLCNLIAPI